MSFEVPFKANKVEFWFGIGDSAIRRVVFKIVVISDNAIPGWVRCRKDVTIEVWMTFKTV